MSSDKEKQDMDRQMKATGGQSPYEDKDFAEALGQGVMPDKLNLKYITFWSVIGVITVIVLIVIAAELFSYFYFKRSFEASVASEYAEITRLRTQAADRLGSFGVIDDEAGKYHIPVDSAFTLIIDEYRSE
jgi:hypothetical protein